MPHPVELWQHERNKNSSGDEIANVNFLRRYGTYVLQNTKKENLLRLTIASQVLRIQSWVYEYAKSTLLL